MFLSFSIPTHLLLLSVPRTNWKLRGDRAFAVTAPKLWNDWPFFSLHLHLFTFGIWHNMRCLHFDLILPPNLFILLINIFCLFLAFSSSQRLPVWQKFVVQMRRATWRGVLAPFTVLRAAGHGVDPDGVVCHPGGERPAGCSVWGLLLWRGQYPAWYSLSHSWVCVCQQLISMKRGKKSIFFLLYSIWFPSNCRFQYIILFVFQSNESV